MKLSLLAMALAIPGLLCAQTITENDFLPPNINTTSYWSPYQTSSPGANMTWDLSALNDNSTSNVQVVPLAGTPNENDFPMSNYVEINPGFNHPGNDYFYYEVNADGWYEVGGYVDSTLITNTNPWTLLEFPCNYLDAWTDSVYGFTPNKTISGATSAVVDGYGTLIMPYGTLTNVLRVTDTQDYVESSLGLDIYYDNVITFFYKPGVGFPILMERQFTITYFGIPQTFYDMVWIDASGLTSTAEHTDHSIGIDLFPNPATNEVALVFGAQGELSLEVYDATGRLVISDPLGSKSPGIHKKMLNTEHLPAGLYTLRVFNNQGEKGTKQLVIE